MKKTVAVLFILSLLVSPCQAADFLILRLSNGEEANLIGVDIPAEDAQHKAAMEFTQKLVDGKEIRLEFDVQRKDKGGRLLAYIYILVCKNCDVLKSSEYEYLNMTNPDGGKDVCIFLNATLIKAGYAKVTTVPPNVKYQELFVKLEKEAREQKKGLWG